MNVETPVSVIIVNFNGGDLIARSVKHVLASNTPVEVFVSDNASTDNSIRHLQQEFGDDPRLTIIQNRKNLGFAGGNNVALGMTSGDYILYLNPDCLVKPDTISRLREVLAGDEMTGMVGCRVLNPDGTEQKGCRRRVPTPWRTFVRVLGLSHFTHSTEWLQGFDMSNEPLPESPVPVDAISGSLMLVKREAIDRVGPLDEGYFLHCEDLDWCMRFNKESYKVVFVPDVDVTHYQGYSSKRRPVRVMWHMHRGMMRFYRKFFLRSYPLPLTIVVALGVWFRFLVLVGQYLVGSVTGALGKLYTRIKSFVFSTDEEKFDTSFLQFKPETTSSHGRVIVLGGRSQIGHFLIPRLVNAGFDVTATTRKRIKNDSEIAAVSWNSVDLTAEEELDLPNEASTVISLAPIWLVAGRVGELADRGMKRLIVFSSTSRFTKEDSPSESDRMLSTRLAESEERLIAECNNHDVDWTLFRPTMVYGCGMDKNIFSIAGFIRKFSCFIMAGEGRGCRQPVHADDLAEACIKAISTPSTFGKGYNLSGGETLSYLNMVKLVFEVLGKKPRIYSINKKLLHTVASAVSVLPGFGHVSPAMIERMEIDLCFDHSEARKDFEYAPRRFLETTFYDREKSLSPGFSSVNANYLSGLVNKNVLITGAGGFIGYAMCNSLVENGCRVNAVLRDLRQLHDLGGKVKPIIIRDLCEIHNWSEILEGVDAIVHLAGYVHERSGDLSEEARRQCIALNVDVTRRLAEAAVKANVSRFIYVSSVKVHSESSNLDKPVNETMDLFPEGTYAHSKLSAENILKELSAASEMEAVIVRPPLVYGPGVKANFLRLMKLVERGIPLPLAAVNNRRSFVYLGNLVDLLALCIVHPAAAGETFLVSDGEDVSTPVLINMLAERFGIRPKLFPISVPVMQLLAAVGGERSTVDRLVQSLVINTDHVRKTLDWTPPYTMDQGISKTVYWYQQQYDPVQAKQYQLAAYANSW